MPGVAGQPSTKPVLQHTFKAAGNLSSYKFRFVIFSAENTVSYATANTNVALGILQDEPNAASESANIMMEGISLLELGGTVTRGAGLMCHTAGEGITATNNKPICAIALQSGVDGDFIPVLLTPAAYLSSS